MKLLADENFPPTLISHLQKNYHDVKRILRSAKGTSDINVREIAAKENRIIFSFDKDFLKKDDKKLFSVVVFDFPYTKPVNIIPYIIGVISKIASLKKRKKYFTATYSVTGLELLKE